MRLVYVDDSGNETMTVLTGLAIPDYRWTSYLKGWLTFRRQLYRDHELPADYELHAQDWLSKSPEPVSDGVLPPILERSRHARRERAIRFEKALKVMSTFADARLITVYRGDANKFDAYAELLVELENYLGREADFGVVVLDGLDQGLHYRARHRDLPIRTRRVLEDPMECPSHGSQLIQMADLCVHAAFRHVRASAADSDVLRGAYPTVLGPIIEPCEGSGPAGIRNWP